MCLQCFSPYYFVFTLPENIWILWNKYFRKKYNKLKLRTQFQKPEYIPSQNSRKIGNFQSNYLNFVKCEQSTLWTRTYWYDNSLITYITSYFVAIRSIVAPIKRTFECYLLSLWRQNTSFSMTTHSPPASQTEFIAYIALRCYSNVDAITAQSAMP